MAGTLTSVTPWRYQAVVTVQATGSTDEPNYANLNKRCRNDWSGSQPIRFIGVVGTDSLALQASPDGPATFKFKGSCNASSHTTDVDFPGAPFGTVELPGGADVTLVWPPSATGAQHLRHIVVASNAIAGAIDSRTWDVQFGAGE